MQQTPDELYPELTPFMTDFLQNDSGHEVFFEVSGNPEGYPVVFLHGGPGSGCNPSQRRFFDPDFYQIILVDQRGCGRSTPIGSTTNNTTTDLVNDLESIRKQLNIDEWLIFGGSWGSTLALSYALKHPEYTSGLILRGIFLARPKEMQWFLGEITRFYPEVWQTLCVHLSTNSQDVLATFEECIFSEDKAISIPAAVAWNAYESSIMRLQSKPKESSNQDTKEKAQFDDIELARARIQIHYIKHDCFIDGEKILEACSQLTMPTVIVQGRYDMVCPPETAWELKQKMSHAQLIMVPDAGHSAMETGTRESLVQTTNRFKALLSN